MARLRISNTATATLDHWLDQFMRGVLHYGELPSAVEAYLHVGYDLGRESRQHEIDQLEREVQRLHYLAFYTPNERREQLLARLDHGLATATEEQWQQLENDLAVMAGRQPNTDLALDPAPGAEIEGPTHDRKRFQDRDAA